MRISLLFALIIAHGLVQAGSLTGRVARVTDGDALVIVDANYAQHKVRLLGIDAPERSQPYGSKSKEHLSYAVVGKFVVVEYDRRDRHSRVLGKVLLNDRDMNLEQIKAGLAWHSLEQMDKQSRIDRQKYADAVMDARRDKRGLWADPAPASTWGHRKAGQEWMGGSWRVIEEPETKLDH